MASRLVASSHHDKRPTKTHVQPRQLACASPDTCRAAACEQRSRTPASDHRPPSTRIQQSPVLGGIEIANRIEISNYSHSEQQSE